jgi:hypothetical protein
MTDNKPRDAKYDCGVIDVIEIIEKYLIENGYDGLYYPCECACVIGDLNPCSENPLNCKAGYRQDCPSDCGCGGFHIGEKNETN